MPSLGRFLSEDTVGFAGGDPTLYVYAANNPLVDVDPLGTDPIDYGLIAYTIQSAIINAFAAEVVTGVVEEYCDPNPSLKKAAGTAKFLFGANGTAIELLYKYVKGIPFTKPFALIALVYGEVAAGCVVGSIQ